MKYFVIGFENIVYENYTDALNKALLEYPGKAIDMIRIIQEA